MLEKAVPGASRRHRRSLPIPTRPMTFTSGLTPSSIRFDRSVRRRRRAENDYCHGWQQDLSCAIGDGKGNSRQHRRTKIWSKRATKGVGWAFRADEAFPADITVAVNIGPGTPSAEGPLTTTQVQSYSFTTYAPSA